MPRRDGDGSAGHASASGSGFGYGPTDSCQYRSYRPGLGVGAQAPVLAPSMSGQADTGGTNCPYPGAAVTTPSRATMAPLTVVTTGTPLRV